METLRSQEKFRLFNWAVVGLQHTHTHTHTEYEHHESRRFICLLTVKFPELRTVPDI
jgi:hypothetical protein